MAARDEGVVPTMADVARLAGVSASTVSYALTGARPISAATRERIRHAMEDLGYTPNAFARGLKSKRSRLIALLFPRDGRDLGLSTFEYILGASDHAQELGYHLLLWTTEAEALDELGRLAGQGLVDGALLMEVRLRDGRLDVLRKAGLPFAMIGRTADPVALDFADTDFDQCARVAVDHLVGLGHRHLGFVNLDATAIEAEANRLRARPDVAAVEVKTPEQGLAEFRSRSGFADALAVLHYNPLPAVLVVALRASAGEAAPALVEELRRDPAVDLVQYDAQWRQRLNAIVATVARGAGVVALLLALAALLVIGNTVRLDIQGRRDEIGVMQLLGASDGFVRRPFLYTGFWYGMLAGVMALILIGLVEWALAAPLARLVASYDRQFDVHGVSLPAMLAVLGASAALGWLGAWLAASRHIASGQPR